MALYFLQWTRPAYPVLQRLLAGLIPRRCCRKTGLLREVREARAAGVNSVVIFPKTPENLKTPCGKEAFNPNGLAQRSISLLKDTFPDLEARGHQRPSVRTNFKPLHVIFL